MNSMRSCVSQILKISSLTNFSQINYANVRFYARWAHRRPAKVIMPEENAETSNIKRIEPQNLDDNIIELQDYEVFQDNKPNNIERKNVKYGKKLFDVEELDAKTHFIDEQIESVKKQKVNYTRNEVFATTFDENGDYVYTKMKDNDSRVGNLMLMVKSRKLRNRKDFVLLEGKRLIKDALEAKCTLKYLLFSRKSDLEHIKHLVPKKNIHLYKVAYRDMQMWSDLTTCPGIMGIFKTPDLENIKPKTNFSLPLTIICDNIREPGNLGAILRASVAVGAEKIILTKGCVDFWEPKVLRSSCGSLFRFPIYNKLNWTDINQHVTKENTTVFLADNNILTSSDNNDSNLANLCLNVPVLPYFSVNFKDYSSIVLVIGGETLGLSEESYKFAMENKGIRINIPLNNGIESLNTGTAFGVIAFEIKRQLLIKN